MIYNKSERIPFDEALRNFYVHPLFPYFYNENVAG